MPDTLLSVGFARLTKEAKRRIKGKFADEVNKMKFSSSDIEYTVIYRHSNYFWTENLTVWTVTEDKLYLAKGEEADKLRRSIKAEEIIKSFVSGFVLFLLFAGIALILWHVWRMFYYAMIET